MKKILLFAIGLVLSLTALSQSSPPTLQASNVQITYKTTSGATISWTRGNGEGCVVVVHLFTNSNVTPPLSTTASYNPSTTFGSGTSLGSGNYIVYEGTGTSVFISGLNANTLYYAYVYEWNDYLNWISGTTTTYYNTSINSSMNEFFGTLDTSPSAASVVNSVTPSYTSATINVSTGTGADGRLIYLRPSAGTNAYPSDGYAYTASSTFGSGALLGGGYVVSSSTATSVAVTNLMPATTYSVYSHAYSDGTYPTTSAYSYNSRNYYTGSGYSFSTANYPPTITFSGASSSSICQDVSWQAISLNNITDGSTLENQTVTLSATSSNTSLIPNGNINISYNAGAGTATILYVAATGQYGTATISITANDGYATTPTTTVNYNVTVNPKPFAAGTTTINGNTGTSTVVFCGGTNVTASIPAVSFATGYNWNIPAGSTILSGANTNSITVSTPTVSAITNYTISVTPTNSCGNGTSTSRAVQVDPNPTTPVAGVDQINLCGGTAFLSANTVTGSNVGVWTLASGSPTPSIGSAVSSSTSISGLISPNSYAYVWNVSYTGSSCPTKRDTVIVNTNWAHPSCQPSANFSYSPISDVSASTVCVGTQLNFTDLSVSANQWQWDFEYDGSANYTSTSQNPSYTYNTVGTYSVYLNIYSNATSQFYNITKVINVVGAPSTPGMIFGTTNGICANSPNQYAYSLSSVTNATNYNWTLPTGANIVANPSNTSVVLMFAANAVPGNLSVNASNSCGTSANSDLMINISPLPVMPGAINGASIACQGEQNVSLTVPSITYATSYEWTLLDGSQTTTGTPSYSYDIGLNEIGGRVYVKGVNACGNGDSVNFNLNINPLPANVGGISGNTLLNLCPVAAAEAFSLSAVDNATNYTWNVSAGIINSGTGTNAISVDFTGVTGNVTIQAIPSNSCGVRDSSPVFNLSFSVVPVVDLCIISVDTASLYNEIYWARPATNDIDSFRVYRKVSALVDTLVATVAYEDETYVLDTLTDYNPNSNFEEYTITAVDDCGNEGQKSAYHRTMFLSTSNGTGTVNLNWNLYVGQTVNFYQIYRDTTIAGNQWELLDGAINPNVTVWVDNTPHPNGRYKVEVDWLTSCDPTRGAINTTRSNIKSPSSVIGIKEVKKLNSFTIAPNPANDIITLNVTEKGNHTITIIDALGKIVYSENILFNDDKHNVNISTLASGVYSVLLYNEAGKTSQLLIKQ
ncbi:MAG: T9SS type A sorting domain-containing protein [Bacteroidetes bacterium]|nr:T9SS type A sorting domain-containing protein [Bacteroidota bacterium]